MRLNNSIRTYMAKLGKKGGKKKSERKTATAQANARKGGWPKGRSRKKPA